MRSLEFTSLLVCFLVLSLPVFSSHSSINAQARRYEITCSAKLWNASMDSALSQVGIHEKTGNNDGVEVERYLHSVGLYRGNPYCYAGQYWSFKVAAVQLREPVILLKSGLASAAFNYAVKSGVRVPTAPQPYDLIFWKFSRKINGHVGRIYRVLAAGWVETMEFNTASGTSGDQRNGGGNYIRRRNIKFPLGRMLLSGYIGRRS